MGKRLFFFTLLLFSLTLGICAADPAAAVASPPDADWLNGLLVWATGAHPWVITVLLVMGLLRVCLKPVFSFLHMAAAGHPAQAALLEKLENSMALQVFAWLLDWVASIKLVPVTPIQRSVQQVIDTVATSVKQVPLVLCAAVVGVATGCAVFQKTAVTVDPKTGIGQTNQVFDVQKVVPIVRTAAEEGTRYPLLEHPEWREQYLQALAELKVIEGSDSIDFSLVTKIVEQLPLPQLKSTTALIAIDGGKLALSLVDAYLQANGDSLSLEQTNDARAVVTALRQGVEAGLGNPATAP